MTCVEAACGRRASVRGLCQSHYTHHWRRGSLAQFPYVSCRRSRVAGDPDFVPNAPLRAAFERSGMTKYELAMRLGHCRRRRGKLEADTKKVRVWLGYTPSKKGEPCTARLYYDNAVAVVMALGLDPVAFGV